jgi:hypothetical protein
MLGVTNIVPTFRRRLKALQTYGVNLNNMCTNSKITNSSSSKRTNTTEDNLISHNNGHSNTRGHNPFRCMRNKHTHSTTRAQLGEGGVERA